jgi:ABC-type bacteriocin/lantibiotic exporter with double-glycine peptidase domain
MMKQEAAALQRRAEKREQPNDSPVALSDRDPTRPRIAIERLDFYYGSNQALKGITLNLPDRQVTGMIGPSGCGKSTLLRVLNHMYDLYPASAPRER